jgi:hypothetical protein
MGSIRKYETISGRTLQEAFKKLQEEDGYETGHEIYSGSWVNCQGIREVSAEIYDRMVENDEVTKFETGIAKCITKPIGNTNTIKTEVKRIPNKGTRQWKTVYVAVPMYGYGDIVPVQIKEEKLQDAIDKARKYIEKHPDTPLQIKIAKELQQVDPLCAEIRYKKSSKERDGVWEICGAMSY